MKNFSPESQNNVMLLFLPSIFTQNSNLRAKDKVNRVLFTDALKDVINYLSLSKEYTYKLDFSLYLHTNDESKDLTNYPVPTSLDESSEHMPDIMLSKSMLEIMFGYQGFYVFHTDLIDFRTFNISSTKYADTIYRILWKNVLDLNEDSSELGGFVIFKEGVVLKITRSS